MIEVFQILQKAKTHTMPLGNHTTQQKLTETTENWSALTKTPNFGIFRFIPVYSALFGCHSGLFRYILAPFLFIPVLFRLNSVPFLCLVMLVLLVYSALFCCHSASFRYILVPFLFIPSHSGVIRFYSRVIPPCSGIFRFIPVYSALFVCHSASFRFVSVCSGTILVHSVSFWCHSGIFCSFPVFSNACY